MLIFQSLVIDQWLKKSYIVLYCIWTSIKVKQSLQNDIHSKFESTWSSTNEGCNWVLYLPTYQLHIMKFKEAFDINHCLEFPQELDIS